jgi:hypothetical protein
MLRAPRWPPKVAECFAVGSYKVSPVPVLDLHELAAGKLAALLARSAERDIFDAHRLLGAPDLDRAKLRSRSWCMAASTGRTGGALRSLT